MLGPKSPPMASSAIVKLLVIIPHYRRIVELLGKCKNISRIGKIEAITGETTLYFFLLNLALLLEHVAAKACPGPDLGLYDFGENNMLQVNNLARVHSA